MTGHAPRPPQSDAKANLAGRWLVDTFRVPYGVRVQPAMEIEMFGRSMLNGRRCAVVQSATPKNNVVPAKGLVRKRIALAVTALIAAAAGASAQGLSPADQADVARVEAYVNRITTFKADFVQIAPNGGTARGTMWIMRPGRLRVEYRPPIKLRIFATPRWLIVEDCKVKDPQYLPLSSTPAGILVQERIALSGGELQVNQVKRENQWLSLRIVDPKSPDRGSMSLVFRREPLQLIGWTVIDQNGGPTQVSLENVQAGMALDVNQFGFISKCD